MTCKNCKKQIKGNDYQKIGLGYIHKDCIDEFIELHQKKAYKKRKKALQSLKATSKEVKYKKSITSSQLLFNRSVRAFWADKDGICTCITCGIKSPWKSSKKFNGDGMMESGHYKSVGARDDLRFNRKNVYPQCYKCNHYGGFDNEVFKKEVIKIIGKEAHDKMIKERKQVKHDLKEIRRESREILKKIDS